VFDDADYEQTLDLIDSTSQYALTGAMYVPSHSLLEFLCYILETALPLIEGPSCSRQTNSVTLLETSTTTKSVPEPL